MNKRRRNPIQDNGGNEYSFSEVSLQDMNKQLSQKQQELEDAQAQIAQLKLESQHILSIHKHNELNKHKSQEANLERKRLKGVINRFEQDLNDKVDTLEQMKSDLQFEKDHNKLIERKLTQNRASAKQSHNMNRRLLAEQSAKKKKMNKLQKRLSRQLKTVASIQSSQDDIQKLQEEENREAETRIRNLKRIINKTS